MRGINKAIILGTVGKDPEIRSIANGSNTVCSFSMATSEAWKDKQTGQLVENTEWHNVKCFGKTAEIIGNYVRKGSKLYIEGKIKTDKWQDKNTGQDKYATYILADNVQLLDGKKDNQPTGQQSNQQYGAYRGNPQSKDLDDDISF